MIGEERAPSRSVRLLFDVPAGRLLDHVERRVARFRWSPNGAAGMAFHPDIPIRPPATWLLVCLLKPVLRLASEIAIDPITALVAGRRVDDAGNVSACGEHE